MRWLWNRIDFWNTATTKNTSRNTTKATSVEKQTTTRF